MAKPGYFDIENKVIEKLARSDLSGTEFRIVLAVLRKTKGWHKEEDRISQSQLVETTELPRRTVRRTLERIIKRNIIFKNFGRREKAPGSTDFLMFNKDFETWKTRHEIVPLARKGAQKMARKSATQKKRKTSSKKTLKKEYFELADLLKEKILQNDPKAKVADTKKKQENWADDFRLLIEEDGRSIEEIREVLIWCQEDPFWRSNILSAGKLRKQFTQLRLKKEVTQRPRSQDPAELTRKEMKY